MPAVAKKIIRMEFKPNTTLNAAEKMFYAIMRKHGIKQGTKTKGKAGILRSNFEWTMCRTLFVSRTRDYFDYRSAFGEPPKDLLCY